MLLSRAIERIQLLMGNRSDLATKAVGMLQDAQDQLEKGPIYPWFLLSEDAQIRTTIGERRIPLPSDYIGDGDVSLYYLPDVATDKPVELTQKSYEKLRRAWGNTAVGKPEAYTKQGLYFVLFPIPNALYTVQMKYYRKDTPITTLAQNATNKWLTYAPDCIIGKAGMDLAVAYRDGNAFQKFQTMESEGRQILTMQDTEQGVSDEELIMGEYNYDT